MGWASFPDHRFLPGVGMSLVGVFPDRRGFAVTCKRGCACGLPVGRFAVSDPDDVGRWTFWRVEQDGAHRVLRPWPADVRWAPLRPPYPEGLNRREERREWSDRWYRDVYFGWKDAVVDAIAEDPQGAADAFVRLAPDAEWPEPTKPRTRARRPVARPVSAKQRMVHAERLLVAALARAGMSERQIASELGVSKSRVHRRLAGEQVADAIASVMLEARITGLLVDLMAAVRVAQPEDAPRLRQQLDQIARMQLLAAGERPSEVGVFGPRLAGGRVPHDVNGTIA